jgi:hypothetical protein
MKKLALLALLTIISSFFTACEEPQKESNELAGTLWESHKVIHDYVFDKDNYYDYYIEFIDDNNFKVWGYDGRDQGTYEIQGKTVYFDGLSLEEEYVSATFTSNSLNLKYKDGFGGLNDRTYYKK